MFRRKTVFVVGAGASFEAGLPTGDALRGSIAKALDIRTSNHGGSWSGDLRILEELRRHVQNADGRPGNINPYLAAAWIIRDAMPLAISIDNFLEAHAGNPEIELCGKIAIAKTILDAEAGSLLRNLRDHPLDPINMSDLAPTWFVRFFRVLTEGVAKADVDSIFENVSIISFNYDRCIEHFLPQALSLYYELPPTEAQQIVRSALIFHPYGTVGKLPWQGDPLGGIRFGQSNRQLLNAARQIKTFTESVEHPSQFHAVISEAELIVFLGFAYHRQNLRLLTPQNGVMRGRKKVIGTTFGISVSDVAAIKGDVHRMMIHRRDGGTALDAEFEPVPMTCASFFDAYSRTLSS